MKGAVPREEIGKVVRRVMTESRESDERKSEAANVDQRLPHPSNEWKSLLAAA